MKRLMLLLAVVVSANALSGCIIDDRRGHRYDGGRDVGHCDSRYHDCREDWHH